MCVDDVVRQGVKFGENANFLLAERLGIEHYQVEKAVWCKRFVNLVYTLTLPMHSSIHMTQSVLLKLFESFITHLGV